MDIKQKFREENNMDVYAKDVTDGSFSNIYVKWIEQQLLLHNVVQAKPEKVCELIRQKFDDWVFGLETQAGEKLKVVDSTDFNDIITEIESELKDL
jgi:hypothetical protein